MKSYQCLFILSVSLCVGSFKIFPVANRRLSVSWSVEPSEEASTAQTTFASPSETSEDFTNSPESLLIISEVTAPDEIDDVSEAIKTTEAAFKKSEENAELTTKTEELTEAPLTERSSTTEISSPNEPTEITVATATITTPKSEIAETTTVVNEMTTETTTLSNLVEGIPINPLSVDLLPPKTEYRKHHFDPRYDDWNKVPKEFDGF